EDDTKTSNGESSAKSTTAEIKPKIIGPIMPPLEINTEVEESESNKNKKSEKRRNRTKYRNKQKNEKNMSDYDPLDPDYSTWVPPEECYAFKITRLLTSLNISLTFNKYTSYSIYDSREKNLFVVISVF
ncbi:hypothetical protein L9F63_025122, partial [Diploptera punctata]